MKPLASRYPCLCTPPSSGNVYKTASDTRSSMALKWSSARDSEDSAINATVSSLGGVVEEAVVNVAMVSDKEGQKYTLDASEFITYI
ncbi:hypothetical protein DSO57_1005264 [Entomophthora muscae]|uniref:Uncharacterized protein n=1 Tax=Entomophthora muscae TaxID=34485 RepID=A0ACC2SX79_9FUNG|nr:hypothetical protein DSO57_1005264 [Entomophthora muscae]